MNLVPTLLWKRISFCNYVHICVLAGNEADTSAPTGALALLLQNVGATSPVSTQMPVSEDEDAIFQDTTQNTPQQSVTQPLDVDHSNGGSTVDESQDSQEEDLTRRDTNRQQRFRLKSVGMYGFSAVVSWAKIWS